MLFLIAASHDAPRSSSAQTGASEVALFDRFHETFLVLNQAVLPAYLEHFRGEAEKRAIVQAYADQLADALVGKYTQPNGLPVANAMRLAMEAAQSGDSKELRRHLDALGTRPHTILHREAAADALAQTAPVVLYDPHLFWAHRRLRELESNTPAAKLPASIAAALAERLTELRRLRDEPHAREMSLRRFLDVDAHRKLVREIAWLHRSLGVEQSRVSVLEARQSFLRAWVIGDALFAVGERGRMDQLDPVFLAELGDTYARLGRYDLMLRYMYSEQGLPARYPMAEPIAEMARVAESVRLAHRDQSSVASAEETLPETVSQILFDEPAPRATPEPVASNTRPRLAWAFIAIGSASLLAVSIRWLTNRRARGQIEYVASNRARDELHVD